MIISNEPTDTILVGATVCSDWDSCNCAVVYIDNEILSRWYEWDRKASTLRKESDSIFRHVAIGESAKFLDITNEELIEALEKQNWVYVTIEDDDEDLEELPEQKYNCQEMKFYGNGEVCWVAYGKNTSDEFYTDTIYIDEIK